MTDREEVVLAIQETIKSLRAIEDTVNRGHMELSDLKVFKAVMKITLDLLEEDQILVPRHFN